jgi:large subunit ribosomal protein L10
LNREQKTQVIAKLSESLNGVPSVVVANFAGLTVEDTEKLRSQLRKAGVHYEVVKNKLAVKAISDTNKSGISAYLKGNTAIAFHKDDPVAPAKIIREFAEKNKHIKLIGGWMDGNVLDAKGVDQLATLPGKNELRGQLLSVFNGASSAFVRLLQAKVDKANEGVAAE